MTQRGFTRFELMAALLMLGLLAAIFLPTLARAHNHAAIRDTCQGNLKQFALIFAMYARESRGERYPPVYFREGSVSGGTHTIGTMPDPALLYPHYLSDPAVYFCPTRARELRETSAATAPDEILALLESEPARKHAYVYFGHMFDKADAIAGWTVPMSILRPAFEIFGIKPPPGDAPIPAQCAAWLLQLAENAQQGPPLFTRDRIDSTRRWIEIGLWNGILKTYSDLLPEAVPRRWRSLHVADLDLDLTYEIERSIEASRLALHPPPKLGVVPFHLPEGGAFHETDYEFTQPRSKSFVGNFESHEIYRLRRGIEAFMIEGGGPGASARAAARTILMLDSLSTHPSSKNELGHGRAGAHVLFIDGHVEYRVFHTKMEEKTGFGVGRFSEPGYYHYPANDPMHARQPVNLPMAHFIAALRGE